MAKKIELPQRDAPTLNKSALAVLLMSLLARDTHKAIATIIPQQNRADTVSVSRSLISPIEHRAHRVDTPSSDTSHPRYLTGEADLSRDNNEHAVVTSLIEERLPQLDAIIRSNTDMKTTAQAIERFIVTFADEVNPAQEPADPGNSCADFQNYPINVVSAAWRPIYEQRIGPLLAQATPEGRLKAFILAWGIQWNIPGHDPMLGSIPTVMDIIMGKNSHNQQENPVAQIHYDWLEQYLTTSIDQQVANSRCEVISPEQTLAATKDALREMVLGYPRAIAQLPPSWWTETRKDAALRLLRNSIFAADIPAYNAQQQLAYQEAIAYLNAL